ncbi:MAG: hypothetical protein AAFV86_16260 [Pseudomonadota bacterium]
MLFLLIATLTVGLGAAGLVLGPAKLLGRRAPRWAAPVAAGLAMFAFTLWQEYTWFDRSTAVLPEGARVAETYDYASAIQPWTLVWPRVWRFAAVVPGEAGEGGLLNATVLLAQRFADTVAIPHVIDCAAGRRAPVPPGAASGNPEALSWTEGGAGDPLVAAACDGRATGAPQQEGDTG